MNLREVREICKKKGAEVRIGRRKKISFVIIK